MEIPKPWRTTHQRIRLEGKVCQEDHKIFPPRPVCLECFGEVQINANQGEVFNRKKITSSAKEASKSSI